MTKFKFRLDPALRLRQLRAEAEKARVAELTLQRKRLEAALRSLQEERAQAARFVYEMAEPGANDLRALSVFALGVEARSRQMAEAIARANTALNTAKQRLLAAERDERALEKLRAKRLDEWELQAQHEIESEAQELWLLSRTNRAKDGKA